MKVDFFPNSLRNAEATTFVEWPFYLEVEPATDATERDFYISSLALMLKNLRSAGVNVVPSCDFEEELESLAW